MKVLLIHTYYKQRGGEDIAYENEKLLMQNAGWNVRSLLFNNKRWVTLKFILSIFNPVSFFKVYKAINEFKPDIVHIHNWFFGASPSIFLAAKIKKVPIVHTLHNFRIFCPSGYLIFKNKVHMDSISNKIPLSTIFHRIYNNSFFLTFWLLLNTRFNYFIGTWNSIDRFICLSAVTLNLINKSYLNIQKHKLLVKPHFIKSFSGSGCDRMNHFLFVGRLSEEKGVRILLSAFKDSEYQLQIIGDGPLRTLVESFISEHKNVTFLDAREEKDIQSHMLKCNALIVPSICYETFGLAIIEAFGTSTPVLASKLGAATMLVQNEYNGLHFEPCDVDDLKDKIEKWQRYSEAEKEIFRKNSKDTYDKQFTPEKNIEQIKSIYQAVIDEKKTIA